MTEAIALTEADALVGATDACTRPADLQVTRVGLPTAPDLAAIVALGPDLVIASRQENRHADLDALREQGLSVWETDVASVGQALHSMCRLFADALDLEFPRWLEAVAEEWSGPIPVPRVATAIVVGRDPWVVAGATSIITDLARSVGLCNVFGDDTEPYLLTTSEQISAHLPQLVLLLDAPDMFTPGDTPDAVDSLPGRHRLSWYGPSLADSRRVLLGEVRQAGFELSAV